MLRDHQEGFPARGALVVLGLAAVALIGWGLTGEDGPAPQPKEVPAVTATQTEKASKPALDQETPEKLETITFAVG